MPIQQTVLVVGGTGRTGRLVLEQLLRRGVRVRAIVRSAARLPEGISAEPGMMIAEADLLSLGEEDLLAQVRGCDAVISCLGHTTNLKGIFGSPRDLVTRATRRLCGAIKSSQPNRPVRFILMSSVSVNHPDALDTRRGLFEKLVLWVLRGVVPPTRDNQRAADHLYREIGTSNPHIEWAAIRPDTLLEGDTSPYSLHETLVSSLFKPDSTNMANVAHFICELATDPATWGAWMGKLPVVVNTSAQDI